MSFSGGWDLGGKIENTLSKFGKRVTSKKSKSSDRELEELILGINEVYAQTEVLSKIDSWGLAAAVSMQSAKDLDLPLDNPLTDSLMEVIYKYLGYEGLSGLKSNISIPDSNASKSELKSSLRKNLALYENEQEVAEVFVNYFQAISSEFLTSVPKSCITDLRSNSSVEGSLFDTDILNLFSDVYEFVESLCVEFYHDDLKEVGLFDKTRDIFQVNGLLAAGINPSDPASYGKTFPLPTKYRNIPPEKVVENFLRNTPFLKVFDQKLPFHIPKEIRFEHTHVLAGSGHGKTQLLQKLILDDLDSNTGLCVIDSHGDLIYKLLTSHRFSPDKNFEVSEKLVLIDASDVEYPACLNLFGLNKSDGGLDLRQKEILANNTIDLYTYIFSSLLGAELTARQGTMFVYIAKLMMEIPDATIQTLRELMEDGKRFKPYMEKLEGSSRAFFQTQFFSRTFAPVKKQILYRLWAVLSNSVLERMLSGSENKVDLYKAMNEGKIVLINTSKQVLGTIGSEVMGKFFIAMLTQSALKRAAIKEKDRIGFHVYIDEAYEYVDEMFNQFINQTRKYKVGFHLFHQNLDQLPATVRASILSSTAIKFAGGVSSKDAKVLAEEMKTSTEEILSVKKFDRSHAEFSLHVQNLTNTAVKVDIPFGLLENEPIASPEAYLRLVRTNRKNYCSHISEVDVGSYDKSQFVEDEVVEKQEKEAESIEEIESTRPNSAEIEFKDKPKKIEAVAEPQASSEVKVLDVPYEGKGGLHHRFLQNLVKRIANQKGFKATTEKQVLAGTGSVDVYLEGHDLSISCEVSVTTNWKWEASNVTKCLAMDVDEVIVICSDTKHLKKLKDKLSTEFQDVNNLYFFTADDLIKHLDKICANSASSENTVRGYKVKVNYLPTDDKEVQLTKDTIAKVLLAGRKS